MIFFDPLGRPTVMNGSDHCFARVVRPSVRPFLSKQNKAQVIATGETVSLAEWIIDDTCLFYLLSLFCFTRPFDLLMRLVEKQFFASGEPSGIKRNNGWQQS